MKRTQKHWNTMGELTSTCTKLNRDWNVTRHLGVCARDVLSGFSSSLAVKVNIQWRLNKAGATSPDGKRGGFHFR